MEEKGSMEPERERGRQEKYHFNARCAKVCIYKIHPSIHHLLSIYYMPDTVLDVGDIAINKTK